MEGQAGPQAVACSADTRTHADTRMGRKQRRAPCETLSASMDDIVMTLFSSITAPLPADQASFVTKRRAQPKTSLTVLGRIHSPSREGESRHKKLLIPGGKVITPRPYQNIMKFIAPTTEPVPTGPPPLTAFLTFISRQRYFPYIYPFYTSSGYR